MRRRTGSLHAMPDGISAQTTIPKGSVNATADAAIFCGVVRIFIRASPAPISIFMELIMIALPVGGAPGSGLMYAVLQRFTPGSRVPASGWRRLRLAFALAAGALAGVCAPRAHADADAAAWMEVPGASAELVPEPDLGGRVMLYRAGRRDGPPVVLVHGLGQNGARDWSRLIPALADGYAVYALDLPGFGQSDKGNRLYSPASFARAIENVIGPRVGGRFTLIGHSMGGAVSLAYAAAYPERIQRLILVDMAGVLHRARFPEFFNAVGTPAAPPGNLLDEP